MEAPPHGYRRNVGICLINSSKKIFSASRLDIPDAWQMPQGGVDEGEDVRAAAIRELREETGVTSAEILMEMVAWCIFKGSWDEATFACFDISRSDDEEKRIRNAPNAEIMWASSCGLCSIKINPKISPRNPVPIRSSSPQSPISDLQPPHGFPSRRKMLNISLLSIVASPFLPCRAETDDSFELERYTDVNQGFTLLRPKSWIKVEKAGATLLFEDPSKGGNNVGVVVTPVRLSSLGEFGDPQFVSNKLIQAEKRKESTKDVEIVYCKERPSEKGGDIQVYEFEYKLDSTRGGLKTIFSAAFVASRKLYLLNIAHSQQPPLSNNKRMMLEKVLHSFDVSSSTNH